jgi:polyhydroxyalkanoate synthase
MTTTPTIPPASDDPADRAAGLDALLVDAALGRLRWLTPHASVGKLAAGFARRPRSTGRRLGGLAAEMIRIGAGTSTVGPSKGDRRFTDPAWSQNPLLHRVVQAYLATGRTAEQLVSDAELGWRDEQRVSFLVENLVGALAPSNVPLLNPASAKAAIDTAGLNFIRGGRDLVRDLSVAPRVPQMVDASPFDVGRTIAVTPGAVVLRTEMFELIHTSRRPRRSARCRC